MLEERVKKILQRSGWSEGRKIDITNYIQTLENKGYEVFDAAKKFLEEFGELEINPKYIDFFDEEDYDEFSTKYERILSDYECNLNYNEQSGEKTIPVCNLFLSEYIICISESGKLFCSQGEYAENTDDFWNGLLGEYKGGFLDWIDYNDGKEFKKSDFKNKEYY